MPPFDADSQTQTALQGLGTLGSALFPDPSKVAQGYYYGSEARKAQLEGNKLIDQQNAMNNLDAYVANATGRGGPVGPSNFYTPSNVPGAPPIMGPPTVGQAVTTPMPSQAQVAQAAANTPAMVAPYTVGTPQAGSSPAPGAGAPPDQVTTTTNGQVPTGQYGSGPVHPASTNPTPENPGGTVQAPAAGSNGSIAQTPFNLLNFVYLRQRSGGDAASSMAIGSAYLGQLLHQGVISEGEYRRQLASVNVTTPYTTEMTVAGELEKQRIANAGSLATTLATQAGETTRTGMALQDIIDPNDPSKTIKVPLSQLQGLGGRPSMTTGAATTANEPVLVDQGPGKPPIPMSRGRAIALGSPIYQPQSPDRTYGTYVEPNAPLNEHYVTAAEAAANSWVQKPTQPAEVAAQLDNAILREQDPAKKQALIAQRNMLGQPQTKPEADEDAKRQFLIDQQLEKFFPPPAHVDLNNIGGVNNHPAGASPQLGPVISDLANQYEKFGDFGVRGNIIESTNRAIQQLTEQGFIDPQQSRNLTFTGPDTTVLKPAYDKSGNPIKPQSRFRVQLINPATKQPYEPGAQLPSIQMKGRLGQTVSPTTNPPPSLRPPGTDAGPAPAGAAEGQTGKDQVTGQPLIVRGGRLIAQ